MAVAKPNLTAKLKVAEELVKEYLQLQEQEDQIFKRKKEIASYCMDLLDSLQRKFLDTSSGFRFRKMSVARAKYDARKLIALFKKKGILKEARKVFRVQVDEEQLNKMVVAGKVELEEIKELSEVRETYHFRADKLKDESDEDVPF